MLKHARIVTEDRITTETAESDRRQIRVRCVLERMRVMARDSVLGAIYSQQSVDDIAHLRDQLVDSQEQNQTLQKEVELLRVLEAQLAVILHSPTFRLAQAFRAIHLFLIPPGSLRERFVRVGVRAVRRIARGSQSMSSPDLPLVLPPTLSATSMESIGGIPAPPALVVDAPADSRQPANQTVVVGKEMAFSNEELDCLARDGGGKLAYGPLSWPLKERAQSAARSVDLVILSPLHRSGSTLLQRICNSRKETLIWGEHGAFLAHFASIYASAAYFSMAGSQEREDYFSQGQNPNLWIAEMCPDLDHAQKAVVESARAFLQTFYGQYREQHDILGFKEVHYHREELDLIRACCPETEIVFLVRNPLDAWKSTPRNWYLSLDEWTTIWKTTVPYFMSFAATDAHCHLLRYEDVVRQETKAMEILADVAKVSRKQVSMVLAHKIGSHNAGISGSERATILEHCREPMAALDYL